MTQMQHRSFAKSDETRIFDKGRVDLVKLGGISFGKGTFQPGWKWSDSVKPIVKTKSCEAPHLQYFITGRLHIVMDDGTETEFGPGDLALIPPGHDAWVVGSEPVVTIDIDGLVNYAKKT
jgi:hypothetical protein